MQQKFRTICLCALSIVLLFCLSSCDTSGKKSPAEAQYKHDEFTYDGNINWNSSYTDLVKKYGKPDDIEHEDTRLCLWYYKPKVTGYEFLHRNIWFDRDTGRIKSIHVASKPYGHPLEGEGLQVYNDVRKALISKYGEPSNETKDGELEWINVFAETEIRLSISDRLWITYYNTHDYSGDEKYSDIPTITPSPAVTPMPTQNTQGI